MQHEKLYSMRKELAEYIKSDNLLRNAVMQVNRKDIIRGSMIARNSHHGQIDLDLILDGQLQKDVPVKDYVFIQNFCDVVRVAENCLQMGNYVDKYLLLSAYKILAEDEHAYFRKTNPVVYAFNHVPAYSLDIEEKLDDCLRRVYKKEAGNDVVLKAMYIHNKLIDIYPFSDYSAELAIFAMNYYLMENGLAPINMPMRREEYFNIVGENLKGHRQEEFYRFLEKAIYDKMEGTISACKEYLAHK